MRGSLLAALVTLVSCGESFAATANCEQANALATSAICRNPILLNLLKEENSLYLKARGRTTESYAAEKQAEAHFIGQLLQCESDAACLRDRIDDRTDELNAEPQNLTSVGIESGNSTVSSSESIDSNTDSSPAKTPKDETSKFIDSASEPTLRSNNEPIKSQAPAISAVTTPATADTPSSPVPIMIFVAIIVGIPSLLFWRTAVSRDRARDAFWKIVRKHRTALGRRYLQLVRKDAYGREDFNPWFKEQEVFLRTVRDEMSMAGVKYKLMEATIQGQKSKLLHYAAVEASERTSGLEFDAKMSPRDFEAFCAEILLRNGWEADLTKGSGDQGVDILATRNGQTLVAQCKLYSGPVGNKAVQEAHTAKTHMGADVAVVISNGDYTPSARQLADTTSTRLLHFTELDQL